MSVYEPVLFTSVKVVLFFLAKLNFLGGCENPKTPFSIRFATGTTPEPN